MGQAKMINAVAIERKGTAHRWPGLEIIPEEPKQPWYKRAAIWTGVIMAAPTPEKPNGWTISPAVITLVILIGSLVAWGGYFVGQASERERQILERLTKAEDDARRAKDLGLAAASQAGHSNSNTEKKK